MTVRPLNLARLLPFVALAVGAAAQEAPKDNLDARFENGIVAIAEDRVITVEEVRREMAPLMAQVEQGARTQQEFNERLEALQGDIVQNLIDRVLIVKEFYKDEKRRIPVSFIDNAVSEAIQQQFDNDRSKYLAYLRSQGKTQRDFRRDVEEDIIYGYMRSQMRKSQNVVSPVKVETFYKENKDRFFQDDAVHLRLIQFNRANLSDDELRTKAAEVTVQLTSGASFEEVAKEFSQDSRRSRGGDWGWQQRADLKKEFSEIVFNMEKGKYTDPIILPEGGFILYVEDRRHAGIQPIDAVRDQIEGILLQQMSREAQNAWLEKLRRNGYVKYY
ncbi:MAG TPA: peptidylprolyl isomerase [Opitutaceae bacterium]